MALYEVYHNRALYPTSGFSVSELKPNKLAQAITRIHCERFTVPAMFVTVKLIHFSPEAEFSREYVGGIWQSDTKHRCCRIIAYMPSSHYHSDEDYNEHLVALKRAWNEIVNADLRSNQSRKELRSIHIVRTAAVSDMGIIGPKVDEGAGAWLVNNLPGLERRAKAGDSDCQLVVNECRKRLDLRRLIHDSGEEEPLPAYEPSRSGESGKVPLR